MSRDELVENLGTIARSGTGRVSSASCRGEQDHDLKLIGQFGVGFYSVFMVADEVVVQSRRAGEEQGWLWASDGRSGYHGRRRRPGRCRAARRSRCTEGRRQGVPGLVEDPPDRADLFRPYRHPDHPRAPAQGRRHQDQSRPSRSRSTRPARIWTRPKAEITDEQYKEFYHHVAHAFDEPFARVHFTAEGTLSYTALLFVPSSRPFDLYDPKRRHGREALRPAGVHHRRSRSADAALSALRPRRGRFRGPAAQRQPRDAAARRRASPRCARPWSGACSTSWRPRPSPAAEARGGAQTESYEPWWSQFGAVLKEGLYEDADNAAEAPGARPLPQHARRRLDQPRRLCRADEGGPGRDLLHQRREPRRAAHQPAARAGAGQGGRGPAARRPGRRVLAAGGQELPEQAICAR